MFMSLHYLRSSDHFRRDQRRLLGLVACIAAALLFIGTQPAFAMRTEPLRVCADPNNLPFSNKREEGFENELAELVAKSLGRSEVVYTWYPQRRGFSRNTLNKGRCDLIMGVPAGYEFAQSTMPYYRSTYVFVYREDSGLDIRSIEDPALHELDIGVHVVGDDGSNTPGAEALGRRGLGGNLVGYSIYGDYSQPHPPSRLIEAVAKGEVDIAIAWGPLAGYFASRQDVPLQVVPVSPEIDQGAVPFTFNISMAVRKGNDDLHDQLEDVIRSHRPEIRSVLSRYGVPLLEPTTPQREPGEE
ncbi:substrate-binding domain-containing protein [Modicisalibacter luteus]|nr:substrate-binding domain-containing protein [Halomonas lutea]GHB12626.1 amino acid ABC transporter substrate-binding protein [Halomonas lutea]